MARAAARDPTDSAISKLRPSAASASSIVSKMRTISLSHCWRVRAKPLFVLQHKAYHMGPKTATRKRARIRSNSAPRHPQGETLERALAASHTPNHTRAQRVCETPAAVHTDTDTGAFRAPGANKGAVSCGRVASGCQNTPRQHQISAHRVSADTLSDRHIRAHKKLARAQKVTRTETLLQRLHI